jgi:hypothetical protein
MMAIRQIGAVGEDFGFPDAAEKDFVGLSVIL